MRIVYVLHSIIDVHVTAGGTGSRAGEEEEQEPQKKKRKPLLTLTADRYLMSVSCFQEHSLISRLFLACI